MAEVNPAMALATASLAAIVGDACAFPLDTLKVGLFAFRVLQTEVSTISTVAFQFLG